MNKDQSSTNLFDKFLEPFKSVSTKELALLAALFPLAYLLEEAFIVVFDRPITSVKIVFILYYIFASLVFARWWLMNVFLALILFILSGISQLFDQVEITQILIEGAFTVSIVLIIQLFISEWSNKKLKKSDKAI